uniref:Uncharacterized protein n=1 Tax=Trichuris muris TaxID=70415 RepID=A0A5S6R1A3_TRIMR
MPGMERRNYIPYIPEEVATLWLQVSSSAHFAQFCFCRLFRSTMQPAKRVQKPIGFTALLCSNCSGYLSVIALSLLHLQYAI